MTKLKPINYMKKSLYLIPVILIGIFIAGTSCKEVSKESCENDTICAAKEVTACCTAGVCVYKYNGKVYTEDQKSQLATDLGCASQKSAYAENDLIEIKNRLTALMNRVQCKARSKE